MAGTESPRGADTRGDCLTLHCTGFQARSRRGRVELDPQVSPEEIMTREVEIMTREVEIMTREVEIMTREVEIMTREVELGCESWTSFASGSSSTAVQRALSL